MPTQTFANQLIRISELAVTSSIIRDTEFRNCVIYGPAILTPMDGTSLVESYFTSALDEMLWEILPGRETVVGVIALERCTMSGCRFVEIGFAGPQAFLEKFREGIEQ